MQRWFMKVCNIGEHKRNKEIEMDNDWLEQMHFMQQKC